jgi:hypothetical protein
MAQNFAENKMKLIRLAIFISVIFSVLTFSGCGLLSGAIDNVSSAVGLNDTGTVIALRAQIRSSYAVVAADLLEVKRGMSLNILEETDFEKVKWYRVRANDDEQTEGWIEAQNVIIGSLLDKSRKLAEEDKEFQAQAEGQLRASTNLRLTPEQKDDNILLKLEKKGEAETNFQIVSWKYVLKADAPDVDDSKSKQNKPKTRNEEIEAAKEENKPLEMDEKYDIWYKVRLSPSVSPAPSGWIFGRQVELTLPPEIAIYQKESNKLVTWQRLDGGEVDEKASASGTKISKPSSWVILLRSNVVKSIDGNEPDFDSILVLGYDKYDQAHYKVYRNENIQGKIPMKVEGSGDNKSFVVKVLNGAGQLEEKRFAIFKDVKGRLKVTPPADIPADKKDEK